MILSSDNTETQHTTVKTTSGNSIWVVVLVLTSKRRFSMAYFTDTFSNTRLLEWMYIRSFEHHNSTCNPERFSILQTERAASLSVAYFINDIQWMFSGKIHYNWLLCWERAPRWSIFYRSVRNPSIIWTRDSVMRVSSLPQWCSPSAALQLPDTSTPCGLHEQHTWNTSPSVTHAFLIRLSSALHLTRTSYLSVVGGIVLFLARSSWKAEILRTSQAVCTSPLCPVGTKAILPHSGLDISTLCIGFSDLVYV